MLRDLTLLLATAPLLTAAVDGGVRSVIASCADGSVVFATKWEDVRCEGAIRVPAGEVPQVGSVWDRSEAESWERWVARESNLEAELSAALLRPPAPRATPAALLTLDEEEIRDLKRTLAHGAAPAAATLEHWRGVGSPDRMTLAHSHVIAAAIRNAFRSRGIPLGGSVIAFHLEPDLGTPKLPVPAFGQGGVTFRPDPRDPRQFGWLAERRWGSAVGYVVLPRGFDVERPMAIFWGDSVIATRPIDRR